MDDHRRTAPGMQRRGKAEVILGAGALAMAAGAFAGHLLAPDKVADHYGWVHDRWYQREIGAFNAGLGYGIIAYARGRSEDAFLGSQDSGHGAGMAEGSPVGFGAVVQGEGGAGVAGVGVVEELAEFVDGGGVSWCGERVEADV